jgi:multidrug efflux pump subunit AcrB
LPQSRLLAEKLMKSMHTIPYLRDIQIAQPLDYPTVQINYDRVRTGQMGLTVSQAGRSVLAGTSSSRFTEPVYWLDNASGNAYQVQVEYPQLAMNSPEQMEQIPVGKSGEQTIFLRDIAEWKQGVSIGEYDRINQQRFITVTANLYRKDLGRSTADIQQSIASLGALPPGVKVYLRGQSEVLKDTTFELSLGLLLAVVVIGLLLTAWFQSLKLSMAVLFVVPGVLAGSMLLLWLTGNTMNIQSFMGCIMAVGVAVSNAVLLVSKAESFRAATSLSTTAGAVEAAGTRAAGNRLRPILMTSLAMIAGMIPMSLGLGESGRQTAPLGIAVIGGLLFSTVITLCLIPVLYDWLSGDRQRISGSFDPTDKDSKYFDQL